MCWSQQPASLLALQASPLAGVQTASCRAVVPFSAPKVVWTIGLHAVLARAIRQVCTVVSSWRHCRFQGVTTGCEQVPMFARML